MKQLISAPSPTLKVAPSRERELKPALRNNAIPFTVAPSRERELKLVYGDPCGYNDRVAPSRERELKLDDEQE